MSADAFTVTCGGLPLFMARGRVLALLGRLLHRWLGVYRTLEFTGNTADELADAMRSSGIPVVQSGQELSVTFPGDQCVAVTCSGLELGQ